MEIVAYERSPFLACGIGLLSETVYQEVSEAEAASLLTNSSRRLPLFHFSEEEYVRDLGKGAYGTVKEYRKGDQKYAVKVATDLSMYHVDLLENTALSYIRSPYILPILGYTTTAKIVMPVAYTDLRSVRIPPDQVNAIGRKIGFGIACAHNWGFIHGDIKPANILMTKNGVEWNPLIADWGLSSLIEYPSAIGSTLPWRSPESILGAKMTPGDDVWAFGCILAQLETGITPFIAASEVAQLFEIFHVIGTPDESNWKGITALLRSIMEEFPVWHRKELANVTPELSDLLSHIFVPPDERWDIFEILRHPYFGSEHYPPCRLGLMDRLFLRQSPVNLDSDWARYPDKWKEMIRKYYIGVSSSNLLHKTMVAKLLMLLIKVESPSPLDIKSLKNIVDVTHYTVDYMWGMMPLATSASDMSKVIPNIFSLSTDKLDWRTDPSSPVDFILALKDDYTPNIVNRAINIAIYDMINGDILFNTASQVAQMALKKALKKA